MSIPPTATGGPAGASAWVSLDSEGKRERLLSASLEVFSRQGLDAPMSDVADAAGAGVASVYRCYSSKNELLAALVTRRLDDIAQAAREASARECDRWTALTDMLRTLVSAQRSDDLMGEARMRVGDHPDVVAAGARATEALDTLLAAARAEGRLRADATTLDLRLMFAATRAARRLEPDRWPRVLELLIDALDGQRHQ